MVGEAGIVLDGVVAEPFFAFPCTHTFYPLPETHFPVISDLCQSPNQLPHQFFSFAGSPLPLLWQFPTPAFPIRPPPRPMGLGEYQQ